MKEVGHLLFSYQRDNDFLVDEKGNPLCYILNGYSNGVIVYKTYTPHYDNGTYLSIQSFDTSTTPFFPKLKALLRKMGPLLTNAPLNTGLPVSGDSLDFFTLGRVTHYAGFTNRNPIGMTPSYYQKDYKQYTKNDYANEMGEDLNELDSLFFRSLSTFSIIPNGYESTEMSIKALQLLASNATSLRTGLEDDYYASYPWLPSESAKPKKSHTEDFDSADFLDSFNAMITLAKRQAPILKAILVSHESQDEVDEKVLDCLLKLGLTLNPNEPDLADACSFLSREFIHLAINNKITTVKAYLALPPSLPMMLHYFLSHPLNEIRGEEPLERLRRMLKQYRKDALAHHLMPYFYQFTDEGGGLINKSKPALA